MTMHFLGISPPMAEPKLPEWAQGDIRFAESALVMGSLPDQGFAFDNEMPPMPQHVKGFCINSTLVSNAEFLEFIEDGGYRTRAVWSDAGWEWLSRHRERCAPAHWHRTGTSWILSRYEQLQSLPLRQPVRHVTCHEASAWCVWAGRRLPTEPEWECAARSKHPAFRWGDLWEWTDSAFQPYPGFAAGPYREYSAPWFGSHQAVRGASFATRERMKSPVFRNFYLPHRDDLFIGFRTCAL